MRRTVGASREVGRAGRDCVGPGIRPRPPGDLERERGLAGTERVGREVEGEAGGRGRGELGAGERPPQQSPQSLQSSRSSGQRD